MDPLDGLVTGNGSTLLSMMGGLLDGVILRVSLSLIFFELLNMGIIGFFLADSLSRIGPLTVGLVYYLSGFWKRKGTVFK